MQNLPGHKHRSPHFRPSHLSSNSSSLSINRNHRIYQPICLRLLTRRAVRSYVARTEMARRYGASAALTPPLTVPALQRFLGYFRNIQHLLGAPLPQALQIMLPACESTYNFSIFQRNHEEGNSTTDG